MVLLNISEEQVWDFFLYCKLQKTVLEVLFNGLMG